MCGLSVGERQRLGWSEFGSHKRRAVAGLRCRVHGSTRIDLATYVTLLVAVLEGLAHPVLLSLCECHFTQWSVETRSFLICTDPEFQNSLFNSALKQSSSVRRDLDAFAEAPTTSSPALQGTHSARQSLPSP